MSIERVIKFPLPIWMADNFIRAKELCTEPYCICYQRDVDNNGFGPYGFSTDKSQKIISGVFSNISHLDAERNSIKEQKNINIDGVYFYGERSNNLILEHNKFHSFKAKNKMRTKRGLSAEPLPAEPFLFNFIKDGIYDSNKLNYLIINGYNFFLSKFNTPQAGQTLCLFEPNVWHKIKLHCELNEVHTQEFNSPEQLNHW